MFGSIKKSESVINNFTIELSESIQINKIMYADYPLRLGGTPSEITLNELYQKINSPFVYSNALYSKEKHAPYMKNKPTHKAQLKNRITKRFEEFSFTDISLLVVCNMGALGHGVFANKDFEPEECFILYAGVIREKNNSKDDNIYSFSYQKDVTLCVDAKEAGNISRFIQHMPLSFHQLSQDKQGKNESELSGNDALSEFWQWRNIDYKLDLSENDVAWANLSYFVTSKNGVPCIIYYNKQKINKGDQLGISYGPGYWAALGIKPDLFDLSGNVISSIKYGYKEIVIELPMMELYSKLPEFSRFGVRKSYNAQMFQRDLQRKQDLMQPVWFSHLSEPVSIFKLRSLLLQWNVIGQEYHSMECDLVKNLRSILPKNFNVSMFVRNPCQQHARPIYDIVCATDNLMKWSQLTVLIKNPIFNQSNILNKCLKITQEVIFMDINTNQENQNLLLEMLTQAKRQEFFDQELAAHLVPSGPTRNDPKSIIMATSEEALSQILLHNPGMTLKSINNIYEKIDALSLIAANCDIKQNIPTDNDNETKLHTLTFSFFKGNCPSSWKIYPSERLKGKYIGHQVRFFNIPTDSVSKTEPFFNMLKTNGFESELKKAGDKPSIVVDLSNSIVRLK